MLLPRFSYSLQEGDMWKVKRAICNLAELRGILKKQRGTRRRRKWE